MTRTVFILLVSFMISLLAYVSGWSADFFVNVLEMSEARASFASIGVGILIAFLGAQIAVVDALDRLSRSQAEAKDSIEKVVLKTNDDVNLVVRRTAGGQVFDNVEDAARYFESQVPFVREVRNTSIRQGKGPYTTSDFYSQEVLNIWANTLRLLIANGATWLDVLSTNYKTSLSPDKELPKPARPGALQVRYIDNDNLPFTNFIILRYKEDGAQVREDEVLWGWASRPDAGQSKVFLSNSPYVVEFFRNQFDTLLNGAPPRVG